MKSKERVLTAIHRQQPDRVPIGWAYANEDIHCRLKSHFNLKKDDNEGLLEALHVDTRAFDMEQSLPYTGSRLHKEIEGLKIDPYLGIRTRWIENESGGVLGLLRFPAKVSDTGRS